jgi:hypothetical protein
MMELEGSALSGSGRKSTSAHHIHSATKLRPVKAESAREIANSLFGLINSLFWRIIRTVPAD